MNDYPFNVSLDSNIRVQNTENGYRISSTDPGPVNVIALAKTPEMETVFTHLQAGDTTTKPLMQALTNLDGQPAAEQFAQTLQQLEAQGWLNYAVSPLAVAIPLGEEAKLNPSESNWIRHRVSLSANSSQRPHGGVMVLESPDSQFQVKLLDWRANALLAQLAEPKPLAKLTPPPDVGPETAYQFLDLLRAAGFLQVEPESSALESESAAVESHPSIQSPEREVLDSEAVVEESNAVEAEINTVTVADGDVEDSVTHSSETEAVDSEIALEESNTVEAEIDGATVTNSDSESSVTQASETEASEFNAVDSKIDAAVVAKPIALHPHDLDDRIPGLADLHNQTLGDPQITIVIIDGDPDHTLSCFEGAEVSKVFPYWHEPAELIAPEDYAAFQSIRDQGLKGKEKEEALEAVIPDTKDRIVLNDHACHVTSIIVGQEHSPVFGIAPNCRAINMPQDAAIRGNYDDVMSPLNLARAFELALELGANIIHCAFCRPTRTGEGEELLVQAIKKCQDNNVLIVSPTGNNSNECWCLPAVLPGTLGVGAAKVDGTPCHFNNWGGTKEGILAPGEDVLGAQPYTDKPVRLTGTSMAAPVMTGISALLMSLQVQQGKPVDAEAVRTALLKTAIPCDPEVVEEPERCLRGFVNIPGAMKVLFGQPSVTVSFAGGQATRTEHPGYATVAPASIPEPMAERATPAVQAATATEMVIAPSTEPANPATVEASTAFSGNVYALGTIGYDFGDEARLNTFKERMADPYDARQMVEHLDRNPDEARSLIWTLNLEGDVIYALDPKGPFATNVYEIFLQMLAGQLEPETSADFIERLSVPARRTTRTVELFSGEVMPVVNVRDPRGMYGWNVNALVDAALATVEYEEADEDSLRQGLTAFLNRVYHDLHNLGQTSRDRALNFTVTNTFQAASTFAQVIASGRQLDTIEVNKSPYCRLNSDCWDVLLTFYDPEHGRRSRRVFRFTLDVVYVLPVTVGSIKSWSLPGKGTVSK
uniref:TrfG n=1 Tax=Prochloron sp. L6 TaxID=1840487 RepID=A0A166XYJ5_9PROC|nr:TrfG [Prochloron sp. L6]